jgi:lysophospholipase L1-like esterase
MNQQRKRSFRTTIGYIFFLLIVVFVALEIILRIYNPFPAKIRGSKYKVLTNASFRFTNKFCPKLDSVIMVRTNSIGFRGPKPPTDMPRKLSILAVGGSTTICSLLSEGETWTDVVGDRLQQRFRDTWINNAGQNGYSTYAHNLLIRSYLTDIKLSPKVALLLVGANDVDRGDLAGNDTAETQSRFRKVKLWLREHSEAASFLSALKNRLFPPKHFGLQTCFDFKNFQPRTLTNAQVDSALDAEKRLLPEYRTRVLRSLDACKEKNIAPVLITQPLVITDTTNEVDGKKLADYPFQSGTIGLFWLKLQLYNRVLKDIAAEQNIFFIDLAGQMRFNIDYYHDPLHFTSQGAAEVGRIVYERLSGYLDQNFQQYRR